MCGHLRKIHMTMWYLHIVRRRVTVNLSETEYANLDVMCSEGGHQMTQLVHSLIIAFIQDHKKRN